MAKCFTEQHRRRISKAKRGVSHSKSHCENISRALKGKKFTEAHKKKIAKSLVGNCNSYKHGGYSDRIVFED
jgi:hypothetical protein